VVWAVFKVLRQPLLFATWCVVKMCDLILAAAAAAASVARQVPRKPLLFMIR
jgi:hypothetical protein